MPRRPDIDAAVEHIGRYAGRDEWVAHRREHLAAMAEAFNRIKDTHYRRTLDEPVPMLDDRTPRECARSKQGRRKLANWIKEIENGELRQAAGTEVAPYDVSWMWRELGVEDER